MPQHEPQPDGTKARDLFTGIALRGAIALQKPLGLNEDTFLGVVGHTLQNSRSFYLYGVLDEVLKAATAMLRWQEFLMDPEKDQPKELQGQEHRNHITRVVEEAVQDEQHLWARKLTELLCDLILFESTNNQEYYRLFLTCEHLDSYLGLQRDFYDFFNCKNLNAEESIKALLSIVRKCATHLDLKQVWFLKNSLNWDRPLSPGNLFCSSRQRYKLALSRADVEQKVTLGISYERAYSVPSRSIHANIGGPPIETNRKTIEASFGHIALCCAQVILQVHKLAGVELVGDAEFLDKIFKSSQEAKNIVDFSYGKELELGDIVFAYGKDLCSIIDKANSDFGYISYKIRYLSKAPLEEVPEDWFPAPYIHLVWPRKGAREMLIEILIDHNFPPYAVERIRQMQDKDFSDQMMAKTALMFYQEGGFDALFKKPSEAVS